MFWVFRVEGLGLTLYPIPPSPHVPTPPPAPPPLPAPAASVPHAEGPIAVLDGLGSRGLGLRGVSGVSGVWDQGWVCLA